MMKHVNLNHCIDLAMQEQDLNQRCRIFITALHATCRVSVTPISARELQTAISTVMPWLAPPADLYGDEHEGGV